MYYSCSLWRLLSVRGLGWEGWTGFDSRATISRHWRCYDRQETQRQTYHRTGKGFGSLWPSTNVHTSSRSMFVCGGIVSCDGLGSFILMLWACSSRTIRRELMFPNGYPVESFLGYPFPIRPNRDRNNSLVILKCCMCQNLSIPAINRFCQINSKAHEVHGASVHRHLKCPGMKNDSNGHPHCLHPDKYPLPMLKFECPFRNQ